LKYGAVAAQALLFQTVYAAVSEQQVVAVVHTAGFYYRLLAEPTIPCVQALELKVLWSAVAQ